MNRDTLPPAYKVIVSTQEQYSIWPAGMDLPLGWVEGAVSGSLNDCLAHIGQTMHAVAPTGRVEFLVLTNKEEMLTIHPTELELPLDWQTTNIQGSLADCLNYIHRAWSGQGPIPVPLQDVE
jgi:MbtH protein